MGYATHERKADPSNEWYTPPELVKALGEFDLDPCAGPDGAPLHARENMRLRVGGEDFNFRLLENDRVINLTDDGLAACQEWRGLKKSARVWLNPPYGRETGAWLKRLAEHSNGIALTFARTDTQAFFDHVWGKATGIMFLKGRMSFLQLIKGKLRKRRDGRAGAPSVLIAYDRPGEWDNANALKNSGLAGYFVDLTPTEVVWSGWACAIKNILQFGPLHLQDVYHWVERSVHRPENKNIRAKIRQVLNSRNADLFCKDGEGRWCLQRWEQ